MSARTVRRIVASGSASPGSRYNRSQPEKSRNISSMLATCEAGVYPSAIRRTRVA
ncbi:MAG TPA: hypothetical protein VKE22_25570 [Haliangiales bacterium]|nr:hypothetical protein [Haliangiales bacterium]